MTASLHERAAELIAEPHDEDEWVTRASLLFRDMLEEIQRLQLEVRRLGEYEWMYKDLSE